MTAMQEHKIAPGNVIARDVPYDDWVLYYAEQHTEWVDGMVIKLSPVTSDHDAIFRFLIRLLEHYLDETGVAILRVAPFLMKLSPDNPGREPDLQLILKERAEIVRDTVTAGAADVAVEITSQESAGRDYDIKYAEYQAGGVREYWIIDPLFRQTKFNLLDANGIYQAIPLKDGIFRSTVLPRFQFDTRLLWQKPLPTGKQVAAMVEAMLKGD